MIVGSRRSRTASGVIERPNRSVERAAASPRSMPWRLPVPLDAYVGLQVMSSAGRSEVTIAVGESDLTLERLVVIERLDPGPAPAAPRALDLELELALVLEHPNLVRTLRVERAGADESCYKVTEYLDGVTLSELLEWTTAHRQVVPAPAVISILTALLDAVRHGQRRAPSQAHRRLCELPIAADDVLVTYDGRVKVLGFKSAPRGREPGAEPAVDALLSRHRAPGLRRLVDCRVVGAWGPELSDPETLLGRLTAGENPRERVGEGRTALARLMEGVHPLPRARMAARLVAAFTRWRAQQERTRTTELGVAPAGEDAALMP